MKGLKVKFSSTPDCNLSLIIVCAAILFAVFSSHCNAVNLPPSAKLLPPETILVVDVPVFGKLEAAFKKTNFYKLYKDPQMAEFIGQAKTKWQKSITALDENNIIRQLVEDEIYPTGRLTLAFIDSPDEPDSNEPPMTIIAQWGQNTAKVKEKISKAMEKNVEMGGHNLESVNFQGVKIVQAVDEKGQKFGHCFIDDCFIGGVSLDAVKFIIAHIKGATSPVLADDNNYSGTLKAVGLQNDVTAYINIAYLIKKELADDPQGHLKTYFTNLGVDKIGGLGAGLALGTTPMEQYKMKIQLKVNGPKTGFLKAIEPKTAAVVIPRFIPADVASVGIFNLDVKQSFDELLKVLTIFNPGIASILYSPLTAGGQDGSPGLTIKADIVDHLSTGVVVVQSLNKPFSEKSLPSDYFVAVATNNRNAIEKSLSQIHAQMIAPNNPDAKKELLGHTIYLIKLGKMPFFKPSSREPMSQLSEPQKSTPEIPNLAFTVTDTHVILGFQSSVENAIRTLKSSESLKDKRWFNQGRASIPPQAGMANFQNTRATGEFLWWLLKKSSENRTGAGMSAPTASYLIDNTSWDFSLLPDYDKIKNYFGTSVFHLVSKDDGFYAELKMISQQ